MARSKVAFFSPPGDRADYMVEQSPEDLEIVLVDPALSDDEKASMCRDVDAIISSDVSLNVLRGSPNVKLIQTLSAGYDMLDLGAILEMGIPVANNGGANAIAVSEHTIAMMISLSGNLWHQYDITMKQRAWKGGMSQYRVRSRAVGSFPRRYVPSRVGDSRSPHSPGGTWSQAPDPPAFSWWCASQSPITLVSSQEGFYH